jgi:hypothetical protein
MAKANHVRVQHGIGVNSLFNLNNRVIFLYTLGRLVVYIVPVIVAIVFIGLAVMTGIYVGKEYIQDFQELNTGTLFYVSLNQQNTDSLSRFTFSNQYFNTINKIFRKV